MSAAADAHGHGHGGGDANLHPPPIHYSSRIAPTIVGIFLFIGSEIMLFGSFFTVYFFDRVVNNTRSTGTHTGEFLGIAPTGKRITVDHVEIWRIEGDKIVEQWGGTWEFERVLRELRERYGQPDEHTSGRTLLLVWSMDPDGYGIVAARLHVGQDGSGGAVDGVVLGSFERQHRAQLGVEVGIGRIELA